MNRLIAALGLGLLLATPLHAQSLEQTLASLDAANTALVQAIGEQEQLGKTIATLRQDVASKQAELAPDTAKLDEAKARVAAAEAAVAANASAKTQSDLQAAQMRLKMAEIEYQGARSSLDESEGALRQAEQKLQANLAGMKAQSQKVAQLGAQAAKLAQADKHNDASQASTLQQLRDELVTLKIAHQETLAARDDLVARVATLEAENASLQAGNATPQTGATPEPADGELAAQLQARLQARGIARAVTKSGRYLYVRVQQADGNTRSRTHPWLVVDPAYYTLEADMLAGETTLSFNNNQRMTLTVPAADDGATYVFVLENEGKPNAKLGWFRKP